MGLSTGTEEVTLRVELASGFRLLVDGAEVSVTRPQVRTVLAVLASSRTSVSSLQLEDALWPSTVPDNPTTALRTIVSRTRSILGDAADLLVVAADSYSLKADSDWLELESHTSTTSTGSHDVAELESLLERMTGVPFSGVVDSQLIDERRAFFERRRDGLERELVDCYATLGMDAKVVDLALSILDNSPADELVACHAAKSLARLGRKTSGIELLQRTRAVLMESGLSPSKEMHATEQSLLLESSDFSEAPSPSGDDESDSDRVFVGREKYIKVLSNFAPGRSIYVEGEPGIGKTSLLREYALRCADEGIRIVVANGNANATSPMSAVSQLVEGLLDLGGVEPAESQVAPLSMLVPNRVLGTHQPASREALVGGVVEFIVDAVDSTHAVLVIDDAQWLDLASVLVVKELIGSSTCRVLLLARPGHAHRLLGDGDHDPSVERLALGPLTIDESDDLLSASLTGNFDADAVELHRQSGGNPLFLRMLLDLLDQEIDMDQPLPPVVLAAVQRRMEVLGRASRRVLQTAAVIGTTFHESTVAMIEPSADDGLAEAARAGLIDRGAPGELSSFRHAIVADAAYQLLGDADRIALHDQVGRLLEANGADPIVVFGHCREAATLDGWRAADVAVMAARRHLSVFDWEGAVRVADWGLENGFAPSQHRLRIAKAQGELALGVPNSHMALVDGAREALAAEDSAWLVEAVIELCSSGSAALTGLDVDVLKELVDAALVLADLDGRLDELRAEAARAFVYSRHGVFGQDLYAGAFANFENSGPRVQEIVLRNSEAGLSNPRDLALAQRATTLLSEAADRNPELRWLAQWFQYRDSLIEGDGDRLAWALRDIRSPESNSERRHAFVVLGQTFDMEMQLSWAEATMALIHEDFALAERCATQALETGLRQLEIRADGFGEDWVTASYGLLILAIRHAEGRLAELVDIVETSAPLVPAWRVAIVIANQAAGNTERVEEELEALTRDRFAALVPDPTWTAATYLLARPVAEFCEPRIVQELYDMILPYQDRMSFSGLCTFGPMHDACAVLADALGKTEAGNTHRAKAEQTLSRLRERSRWGFDELIGS